MNSLPNITVNIVKDVCDVDETEMEVGKRLQHGITKKLVVEILLKVMEQARRSI
jgi:hypothetical protein